MTACHATLKTIRELAEEIAECVRFAELADEAEDKDGAQAARDKADALAAALLRLDPASPGEALSLLCVVDIELDCFIANHCDDDTTTAQMEAVRKALRGVGRGLVEAGTTKSPLLGTYTRTEFFQPSQAQ